MFKPKEPYCQSCGMPLSKDPHGGGTNKDRSKNTEYCGYCYQKGKFINPDMTLEEMKKLVKVKLMEMHLPGFVADMFAKDIPKLKRWSK